jgi:uncharacterized protein DUF6438
MTSTGIFFATVLSAISLTAFGAINEDVSKSFQSVPSDAVVTLERTQCFGTCPSYKLTVTADGGVVFEGREYVKSKGTFKSSISAEKVSALIKEFEKIDYFSLDSNYSPGNKACKENWTDNPSATTSLKLNGKFKSVTHYYGCRGASILDDLMRLETQIDEIVGTARWIG